MNLMLFGAPGAGKGTQAKFLIEKYNIPQISTGDMFRAAIAEKTKMGMEAKKFMDKGKLVPDETTIGIIKDRLAQNDCKNGFILDGFPRTLAQAEALNGLLKDLNISLDKVISLNVPDELIVGRITGRRVCSKCGASFHVEFNPSKKENICDYCESDLMIRKDDNAQTVKSRLEAYHTQTTPLINYYKEKGIFIELDGTKDVSIVTEDMFKALS
ncbi:adenylate kinase [Aliarcobacter thereius]|uniref:Adenylate kinase n=1 Tax=Aliarcobacter thereius LMG 24486 TaxID=1032240 RepID=A0A1C7WSL7_9BACT|nr:adenylate kinase [Aliarcobacter thereius]OCL90066.1 Adenylate kinase [Aliarcobacter thereius]OCL96334.1 Adenylate kinase [Aliarcobacter thereius LMG 24486]QBF15704.1 adenylate kinase (lid-domain-containing Adk) [Aliarcobacter thereius LMG 24486]TLS92511.1 adenylate kinase [Aliarcobacter thereius]HJE02672.1 adenylate kinase [Aliarcobacter thereius]